MGSIGDIKEITTEVRKNRENNSQVCPFCGSEDISMDSVFTLNNNGNIIARLICENYECMMEWEEEYVYSKMKNASKSI